MKKLISTFILVASLTLSLAAIVIAGPNLAAGDDTTIGGCGCLLHAVIDGIKTLMGI